MYPLTEFSSGLTAADNRVSLRGQPSLCKYFIKIRFLSVKITSGALLEVFSKGVRLPDYNRQEGAPEMMLSGEEGD